MTTEEAGQLVYTALDAAVGGDPDTAADIMLHLGLDSDVHRMYGVCCAIAEGGKKALEKLFGDKAPNLARGEHWCIVNLHCALDGIRKEGGDVLARKFSARFLVARANGDDDTQRTLYEGAAQIGDEHFVQCVYQLFADTAGLCALALKHVEGERG